MSLWMLTKEVEVLRHQGGQFIGMVVKMEDDLLYRCTKRCEGRVEAIAHGVLAQELPEAFDQVQMGEYGGRNSSVICNYL